MDDLVQRLRDLGERVSFGHVVPPAGTYMLKAADRIEALEAAIDNLCGCVSRADWALLVDERTKQTIAALEGKDV